MTRLTRRAGLVAGATWGAAVLSGPASLARTADQAFVRECARIEAKLKARLGVALVDAMSTSRVGYRPDERFPMCSTAKVLACAALLSRVDSGHETLRRVIQFPASDLVAYSPATQQRAGEGMTLDDLCGAALTLSDNTAMNLILAAVGGPQAVTAYARTLGDSVTRLDRTETALNEAVPDDPRDTTTPAAMARVVYSLVLADGLSAESRSRLAAWLMASTTGFAKLRAGIPPQWRVGDKTGAGGNGTSNDVAVLWPTNRAPLVAAVYLTEAGHLPEAARSAGIAAVGRAIASALT